MGKGHTSNDAEPAADWDPLQRLADDDLQEMAIRLRALRRLRGLKKRTRADVEAVAALLGLDASSVYKELRQLKGAGTVRDIAPGQPGYPKGRSRLHPRQDEIIDHWLREFHLKPAKPALAQTTERIGDQCEDEGFGRPARAAVIRRLARIPPAEQARLRGGVKAAHPHKPHAGRLEVPDPRGVYQIDHTLTDVIAVDAQYRQPLGRVWLTCVIDVRTRMVAAFRIGLDAPSILRAGEAIHLAVARKDVWVERRGLPYRWPVWGFSKVVHSDRGSDFRSETFRGALLNHGVAVVYRPVRRPHFGAHIERLNGTLMGRCTILPGATHNSPRARGGYDSVKSARISVDELEAWFAHQILGVYHNSPHRGLGGRTPLEVWDELTANQEVEYPEDEEQFRLDLLPQESRTLTPVGFSLLTAEYYSPELGSAFLKGKRRVLVKFDPRDFSEVYVDLDGEYVPVGLRFPHEGTPPPLWLQRKAQKGLPAKVRRDRSAVRAATAAAEALIQQGAARTASHRRQAERLRQDRMEVELRRAGWVNAPAIPYEEDDWGGAFKGGSE